MATIWKLTTPTVFTATGPSGTVKVVRRRGGHYELTQLGRTTLCKSFGELALVCVYSTPELLFARDVSGAANPNAKLSDARLAKLRAEWRPGQRGLVSTLARKYRISRTQLRRLVEGVQRAGVARPTKKPSAKPVEKNLPDSSRSANVSTAPASKPAAPPKRAAELSPFAKRLLHAGVGELRHGATAIQVNTDNSARQLSPVQRSFPSYTDVIAAHVNAPTLAEIAAFRASSPT